MGSDNEEPCSPAGPSRLLEERAARRTHSLSQSRFWSALLQQTQAQTRHTSEAGVRVPIFKHSSHSPLPSPNRLTSVDSTHPKPASFRRLS